ncbi:MAG TPA: ATP-binding cassette domain-containing protein [Flavobacterium sp.]|jgi:putative ABC transport system ATP-binding protein
MITTKNLSFSHSATAKFQFPDILCGENQALLITGSSGKGKTTLLHLLGGLLRPEGGEIIIGGNHIEKMKERKLDHFRGQNIGIVLQEPHFIGSLSVLENVILSSWLATGKRATAEAEKLLLQLGLEDHLHKNTAQLSIGQQQRVSIARALINRPKLLLADEPTSSLDDENTEIVTGLLQSLSEEYKTALVIVTHDHRLKQRFSNTLAL